MLLIQYLFLLLYAYMCMYKDSGMLPHYTMSRCWMLAMGPGGGWGLRFSNRLKLITAELQGKFCNELRLHN